MSRIGKKPIPVLAGAKHQISGGTITVEGPRGKLDFQLPEGISIQEEGSTLVVARRSDEKRQRALHGLTRALVANMFKGVIDGFTKRLDIIGLGFGAKLQGNKLEVKVGFSHPHFFEVPGGLTVEVPNPTSIVIAGADKQLVGEFAAKVRHISPPEPYGGKGIKYSDEVVKRKAGKAFAGGGAR